ncbi:hypothetical protein PIB30_020240 [Stylosanthes scabra]|uniref:Uncharacterized protein n=1 Tax=Stylosanthes scabra TaxID=79078 RepID=A0ABU6T891_9FABA|nr:hypothetical protein [Stylosanthes scabra]
MIGGERAPPPHGILLAVVVAIVVAVPFLVTADYFTEAFSDLITPFGQFLLPILLLIAIHFLSSDRASFISAMFSTTAEPDSIHHLSGSPVGIALVLLLILILLYSRVSFFGNHDSGDSTN